MNNQERAIADPGSYRVVRVFVAEDDPMLRQFLARLLAAEPGFELCGETGSGEEALAGVLGSRPDVLILDLRMPGRSGYEILQAIRKAGSPTRTLVLTGSSTPESALKALQLGADGFLAKEEAMPLLHEAILALHAGERWVSPRLAQEVAVALPRLVEQGDRAEPPSIELLTRREREIAELVSQGLSNRQISGHLGITVAAVKSHISRALDKLQVSNRTQLALLMRGESGS